jgi:hypothetical protein
MNTEHGNLPTGGNGAGGDQGHSAAHEKPVGYGSPPVATRFPHQEGTRGRKKGSKNTKTLVKEAFEASVTAKINGVTRKLMKKELAFHQLATQASSGNLKAIEKSIPLIERYLDDENAPEPTSEQTAHHKAVLRDLLALERMFLDPQDGTDG